jgi:hypothetical protein
MPVCPSDLPPADNMTRLQTIGIVVLLLATNVLTVLNDDVRNSALGFMRQTLGRVVAFPMPEAVRLHAEIDRLNAENASLIRTSDTVRLATVTLVAATQALIVADSALRVRHVTLQTQVKAQQGAARRFREAVVTRVKRTAARGSASLIARVTPAAGIAANVAVLAVDLADACEVLREAKKVGEAFGDDTKVEDSICGMKVPSVDQLRLMVPL